MRHIEECDNGEDPAQPLDLLVESSLANEEESDVCDVEKCDSGEKVAQPLELLIESCLPNNEETGPSHDDECDQEEDAAQPFDLSLVSGGSISQGEEDEAGCDESAGDECHEPRVTMVAAPRSRKQPALVGKAVFALNAFEAELDPLPTKTLMPWTVTESSMPEMSPVKPHMSTVFRSSAPRPLKMVHREVGQLDWVRTSLRENATEAKPTGGLASPAVELAVAGMDQGNAGGLPRARRGDPDPRPLQMVEFEKEELVVSEAYAAPSLLATVCRKGDLSHALVCKWQIIDSNLKKAHWHQFGRTASGSVEFKPGASEASIALPMVRDPTWNRETYYRVQLAKPRIGAPCAVALGRASRLSVHILNREIFPSNVPEGAPLRSLIWGFLEHNFYEVRREAVWGIWLTLWAFVDVLVSAESGRVLLDCTVQPGEACNFWGVPLQNDSSHDWAPILIPLHIFLACFLVNYWRKSTFRQLRLDGKTTRKLRINLLATMLQLSFDKIHNFDKGDLVKITDWHAAHAVQALWINAFTCLGLAAELCAKTTILVGISLKAFSDGDYSAAVACAPILPVMVLMVSATAHLTGGVLYEKHSRRAGYEKNLFSLVEMCGVNQSLILMLRQVEPTVACADAVHGTVNASNIAAIDHADRSRWKLKWGFEAMRLVVLVAGGRSARLNYDNPGTGLSVGSFSLVMSVVADFGTLLLRSMDLYMEFMSGGSSLKEVAAVLNMSTIRRVHFEREASLHQECQQDAAPCARFAEEHEAAIVLQGVTYAYPSGCDGPGALTLVDLDARIEFGRVCCVTHGFNRTGTQLGMNTLFRMMAGQILPDKGKIRTPGKCRVVYIPQSPVLFDGTLMYNLLYCVLAEAPEYLKNAQEVAWRACKELGMSDHLIGQADFDIGEAGERLKYSDRVCCTFVRALLFDVDVLLLSSLLDALGDEHARQVLRGLRAYVRLRGLPGSGAMDLPWEWRPPKLVLYRTKIQALSEQGANIVCRRHEEVLDTGGKPLLGREPAEGRMPGPAAPQAVLAPALSPQEWHAKE